MYLVLFGFNLHTSKYTLDLNSMYPHKYFHLSIARDRCFLYFDLYQDTWTQFCPDYHQKPWTKKMLKKNLTFLFLIAVTEIQSSRSWNECEVSRTVGYNLNRTPTHLNDLLDEALLPSINSFICFHFIILTYSAGLLSGRCAGHFVNVKHSKVRHFSFRKRLLFYIKFVCQCLLWSRIHTLFPFVS